MGKKARKCKQYYLINILKLFVTMISVNFLLIPLTTCGLSYLIDSGGRNRKNNARIIPLVLKEYSPNVNELDITASGPLTSLHSTSPEPLVRNLNPNIIFRNEMDRYMSKTCSEKLNLLSMIVSLEWPGMRIKVMRGRDTLSNYPSQVSNDPRYVLLEKGRALDIATSDNGYSKNGFLAGLALEAGFNWVHYRERSYIHVSVKPDVEDRNPKWNSVA
ncbi:unnamed protein product [Gordionus sp. m RMFG-2023]